MSEELRAKVRLVNELTRSAHGELKNYIDACQSAIREDADFYAHLTAWNFQHGQVRDAKVALPTLALSLPDQSAEHTENALAHLALLDPRLLVQALDFTRVITPQPKQRQLQRFVHRYLAEKEKDGSLWRIITQHKDMLRALYTRSHAHADDYVRRAVITGHTTEGRAGIVASLHKLGPQAQATLIKKHKLPYLIARGAVGANAKDPVVLQALIDNMTPTEFVTSLPMLKRWGVKGDAGLRATIEAALERAGGAKKSRNTLKTSKQAAKLEAAGETEYAEKLHKLQERQLDKLATINGKWIVLGDKSGSMERTIESARQVAATLTRLVKHTVYLVFFDSLPRSFDVTGHTYDDIVKITKSVKAGGATSIGAGLDWALTNNLDVDGIAIVSDGAENTSPIFASVYQKFVQKFEHEPTVYWYQVAQDDDPRSPGWIDQFIRSGQAYGLQTIDIRHVDHYSLPNVVQTMRVGRYNLLDEVWNTPLRTLDVVLPKTAGMVVIRDRTDRAIATA